MSVLARFRRWVCYQRELSRLISERAGAGYNVRSEHVEQAQAEARKLAGYEGLTLRMTPATG